MNRANVEELFAVANNEDSVIIAKVCHFNIDLTDRSDGSLKLRGVKASQRQDGRRWLMTS